MSTDNFSRRRPLGRAVVDRAIDAITQADLVLQRIDSESFLADALADPVDFEDWVAASECLERSCVRVRRISARLSARSDAT
ncbi:hypothetical protein [Plantibacter sp. CFBP 13570]|uniref:hypothetical protein n=1 Tax=Plantibacter sp. CFBP 13570 TaxID=2775272 RepID=UPI001930D115|nr:hypothetical protein [Plantibacter sp. CFBP 13570]MBD8535662.1 hypothetical protein [Plantibacter sp. CFBP 13570]